MNKLFVAAMTAALVIGTNAGVQAKKIAEDGAKNTLPAVQNPATKQKKKPFLVPYSASSLQEDSIKLREQSPQPNGLIAPMY